ncbi:pirin family protein [Patescibacteria group bacterium]|nr:pirin family protein [Patescibacteria group bacterium]
MIQKIPAADRHYADYGSLQTYWLFSFSDYYDPENMNFGSLRVFNDDVIGAQSGFPDHPHRDMEILTIVHSGTLTHGDSIGTSATIGAGEVQRMSAGGGIVHSEMNKGDEPVHLYQLWFSPNQKTESGYEQKTVDTSQSPLSVLASYEASPGVLLRSDAVVYSLKLAPHESTTLIVPEGWGCFVYVKEGVVDLSSSSETERFREGDQARVLQETNISFSSENAAEALVVVVRV